MTVLYVAGVSSILFIAVEILEENAASYLLKAIQLRDSRDRSRSEFLGDCTSLLSHGL